MFPRFLKASLVMCFVSKLCVYQLLGTWSASLAEIDVVSSINEDTNFFFSVLIFTKLLICLMPLLNYFVI